MTIELNDISEEWKNQNPHIKEMGEFVPLDLFDIQKTQRQLPTQFKIVKFMTETQYHVDKLYKNPQQFGFNRNSHIMTFQPTRVKLGNDGDNDKIQNYINANYIEIQSKKLIACQGPMHSTFLNFWRMIQQNKVQQIFMLCARVQKTKPKCDPYWLYQQGKEGQNKNFTIKIESKLHEKNIQIKEIQWTNMKTQATGVLKHYQLLGWPDGDRPGQNIKEQILKLVKINAQALANNKIPVIHCSAGVGRTGTFIAATQLYMQIQQKKNISIFETVRRLRQYRWGLVYTQSQYEYLYDFVSDLLKGTVSQFSDDSD